MIIVGVLFIIVGILSRPLTAEFWQPGIAGAPTPSGWRGCMNVLVTPLALLEILSEMALKIPFYIPLIGGGLLLLVFNLASQLALSHPFFIGSMAIPSSLILVEWIRVSRGRFCVALRNALVDGVPAVMRYLRGIRDNSRTLVMFRGHDYREGAVAALQWLPPSTEGGVERLASVQETSLVVWKVEEARRRTPLKKTPTSRIESTGITYRGATDVAVSPDGLYTAFSDKSGRVFVHKNTFLPGTRQRTLLEQNIINITQDEATLESKVEKTVLVDWLRRNDTLCGVNAVTWAPSLPYRLAFGANDSTVKVWYIGTAVPSSGDSTTHQHQVQVYREHRNIVTDVAWAPDGKSIASASTDATVHIWNAETGKTEKIYTSHTDAVNAICWSPDGLQMASASQDGSVQVWMTFTGETKRVYRGHTGTVLAVAWSPNGKWIASAGQEKTVQVWEATSGHMRMTYWRHRKNVLAVAWPSDGHSIASGDEDGTIRIWQ